MFNFCFFLRTLTSLFLPLPLPVFPLSSLPGLSPFFPVPSSLNYFPVSTLNSSCLLPPLLGGFPTHDRRCLSLCTSLSDTSTLESFSLASLFALTCLSVFLPGPSPHTSDFFTISYALFLSPVCPCCFSTHVSSSLFSMSPLPCLFTCLSLSCSPSFGAPMSVSLSLLLPHFFISPTPVTPSLSLPSSVPHHSAVHHCRPPCVPPPTLG